MMNSATGQLINARKEIGESLAKNTGSDDWWETLLTGLSSPFWQVRSYCVALGAQIADSDRRYTMMLEQLNSENVGLRNSAIELLVLWGSSVSTHFENLYQQSDDRIRKFVVDAFRDNPSIAAGQVLQWAFAGKDVNLRLASIEAMMVRKSHFLYSRISEILEQEDDSAILLACVQALACNPSAVPFPELRSSIDGLWSSKVLHKSLCNWLLEVGSIDSIRYLLDDCWSSLNDRRQSEVAEKIIQWALGSDANWIFLQNYKERLEPSLNQPYSLGASLYLGKTLAEAPTREIDSNWNLPLFARLTVQLDPSFTVDLCLEPDVSESERMALLSEMVTSGNEDLAIERLFSGKVAVPGFAGAVAELCPEQTVKRLSTEIADGRPIGELRHVSLVRSAVKKLDFLLNCIPEQEDEIVVWLRWVHESRFLEASKAVRSLVLHQDSDVRRRAVQTLAVLDAEQFVNVLPKIIADADERVVFAGIGAVRRHEIRSAVPLLLEFWRQSDPWTRTKILQSVVVFRWEDIQTIMDDVWTSEFPPLINILLQKLEEEPRIDYAQQVILLLSHGDSSIVTRAIRAAHRMDVLSEDLLISVLWHHSVPVREAAVEVVSSFDSLEDYTELLQVALMQEDDPVLFQKIARLINSNGEK
jgi:HEAT repeat protein